MNRSVWSVHIKSGAYLHRKVMVITPLSKDVVVDEAYVRNQVKTQQGQRGQRSGAPMMPAGEIVKCEPRDKSLPLPSAAGQWENGLTLQPAEPRGV